MKYFLIAGEASGDLHASNLMLSIKKLDQQANFRFFGGDLMAAAGGTLLKHYREMAYMGIFPVLLHLRSILKNMEMCRQEIRKFQPDVVILIDYPGFNLKIAQYVKTQLHIPVHYYISPKIWAWKQYRIKSFRRYVDRMFCILPFEKDFFKRMNYTVDYVGNPSVDSISSFRSTFEVDELGFRKENQLGARPILAILSGSRKQEIKNNLPTMLQVADQFPQFQPVIAGAPGLTPEDYAPYIEGSSTKILFNKTYELLSYSENALVTSGTATLETALFRVPQVVCYHIMGGKAVNFIFNHFFHTPFISLVNLIVGEELVLELFGANFSSQKIENELNRIVNNPEYRQRMLEGYDHLIHLLGEPGASDRTAEEIVKAIS